MILYIPYLIFYIFLGQFLSEMMYYAQDFSYVLFFLGGSYMHRCKDQQYYMNNQEVPMATQYTIIKAGSLFPDSPSYFSLFCPFTKYFFAISCENELN